MIRCFAIPLAEFEQHIFDVVRFGGVKPSVEGFHVFLHLPNDTVRVAAALMLGEVAKPYRKSLLVCRDHDDDGEVEEKVRFLTEDLQLRVKPWRFLWVRGDQWQVAVVRAFMPSNPLIDPRSVWERLP